MPGAPPPYEIIDSVSRLEDLAPAWTRLSDETVEPNPFYRPELLLPALRAGLPTRPWRVVVVYAADGDAGLAALVPLELHARSWRRPFRPVSTLRPLTHTFCYLHSPLIHRYRMAEGILGLTAALRDAALPSTPVKLRGLTDSGALEQALRQAGPAVLTLRQPSGARPALRRGQNGGVSSSVRRELAAKRRKLGSLGALRVESTDARHPGFRTRLTEFLDMESRGWKGADGSAMNTPGFRRDYWQAAIGASASARLITIDSLLLDDRPLAMQVNFTERRDRRTFRFGFKSAYDEAYARYSPGALLLDEQRAQFAADEGFELFDSCVTPHNMTVHRVWPDRVCRSDLLIARATPTTRACFWLLEQRRTRGDSVAASGDGRQTEVST